jgi:hypothetical protein
MAAEVAEAFAAAEAARDLVTAAPGSFVAATIAPSEPSSCGPQRSTDD